MLFVDSVRLTRKKSRVAWKLITLHAAILMQVFCHIIYSSLTRRVYGRLPSWIVLNHCLLVYSGCVQSLFLMYPGKYNVVTLATILFFPLMSPFYVFIIWQRLYPALRRVCILSNVARELIPGTGDLLGITSPVARKRVNFVQNICSDRGRARIWPTCSIRNWREREFMFFSKPGVLHCNNIGE